MLKSLLLVLLILGVPLMAADKPDTAPAPRVLWSHMKQPSDFQAVPPSAFRECVFVVILDDSTDATGYDVALTYRTPYGSTQIETRLIRREPLATTMAFLLDGIQVRTIIVTPVAKAGNSAVVENEAAK